MDVPVHRRDQLGPGAQMDGPGILEERTSTVVLYPGQRATIDEFLNLEIKTEAGK